MYKIQRTWGGSGEWDTCQRYTLDGAVDIEIADLYDAIEAWQQRTEVQPYISYRLIDCKGEVIRFYDGMNNEWGKNDGPVQ
jgi:hypothetical protein